MKNLFYFLKKTKSAIYRLFIMPIYKSALERCGKGVYIGPHSTISYNNTSIGDYSSIGEYAYFLSSRAKVVIGSNVMFGPHVSIITGDHRIDLVGRYMNTIKDSEKLLENDRDVVIKDDVWIGANVTILKGVIIGTGSVIAAGSIVTKDVEEFSINCGIPAKKIKDRFTQVEILKHIELIGLTK